MSNLKDLLVRGSSRFIGGILADTISANKLSIIGGASSQFLKADGSKDSTTYLSTSSASSTYLTKNDASTTYLALTGGTLSGTINGTIIPSNKTLATSEMLENFLTEVTADDISNINFYTLTTSSKTLLGAINELKLNMVPVGATTSVSTSKTYYGLVALMNESLATKISLGLSTDTIGDGMQTYYSLFNQINSNKTEFETYKSTIADIIGVSATNPVSPFDGESSIITVIEGLKNATVKNIGELIDVDDTASSETAATANTILIKTFGSTTWVPMDVDDVLNFGILTSAEVTSQDASGNTGSFLKMTFSTGDSVYADLSAMTNVALSAVIERITALENKYVLMEENKLNQMYAAGLLEDNKIYFGYEDNTLTYTLSADGETLTITGAYVDETGINLVLPNGVLSDDGETLTI